jgi:hypothetical protein
LCATTVKTELFAKLTVPIIVIFGIEILTAPETVRISEALVNKLPELKL